MKVVMLSKEGADVAKVGINGDIVLEISTDENDEMIVNADYPADKYTEEEIQNVSNSFFEGLVGSIKKDAKDAKDAKEDSK